MRLFGLNITRAPERKESETWSSILSFLSGREAVYTPTDYGKLAQAGYAQCGPVFSVVSLITRTASRIPWTLQRKAQGGGTDNEIEKHPLLDLLSAPNEYMNAAQFLEAVLGFKLLAGNSYIERVSGSGAPKFLYPLRPDRVKIRPGTAGALVGGYIYEVNSSKTYLAEEDVLHLRDFNPLDDFYGLSRLAVSATSVDILNWIAEWNLRLLQNDMRPPGMLKVNGPLTDAQFKLLEGRLKDKYQGAENAGTPLLIHSAAEIDWQQLSIAPKDMDWPESYKNALRQICAVYNVASELLGDSENKTYSNIQEARKALYQETVLPEMDMLRDGFNSWLVPLFGDGLYLDYDRDGIEALQEDREKKYAYLAQASWLTINEKRQACGYDDIPDGDVVMVGMGDITLGDATAPPGDISAGDEGIGKSFSLRQTKGLGSFWRGENERKALWQNFERRVVAKERAFAKDVRTWLEAQADKAVAKVRAGASTPEDALSRRDAETSYMVKFWKHYQKLYASAVAAGRSLTEGKLYEFDDEEKGTLPEPLRRKLEDMIEKAAEVITDESLAEIEQVLTTALEENLTTADTADALRELLNTMEPVRARRIARTETAMLENAGQLDGFKENEFVNRKGWLCSFVEHSRESHMEADGQEVGIDETFSVGGQELEYPGDRSHGADAGNVINCLCVIYPIVE